MIEKTQALVLSVSPVSESSRVVTWLTVDHGKIFTMIKGSQRPKSQFLGQYDLFYTCELLFYARPRTGLHIARECAPLKTRRRFRRDWRACSAASYLVSLAAGSSQRDAPHPALYRFLDQALDDLSQSGVTPGVLHWNELALLSLLGMAPRLNQCATCHRGVESRGTSLRLSDRAGGVICTQCSRGADNGQTIRPDVLAVLAAWQRSPSADTTRSIRCTRSQEEQASRVLGSFMQYHMDMELRARTPALDSLRHPGPEKRP